MALVNCTIYKEAMGQAAKSTLNNRLSPPRLVQFHSIHKFCVLVLRCQEPWPQCLGKHSYRLGLATQCSITEIKLLLSIFPSCMHSACTAVDSEAQYEAYTSGGFRGVSKVSTEPPFWLDQVLNKY